MSAKASRRQQEYMLRLYIAENTPQSAIALENLQRLCDAHLAGRYHLEVIDLMKNPELAKADQILAVPTLVRKMPTPIRKFIGTLSDTTRVLVDFALPDHEAAVSEVAKG